MRLWPVLAVVLAACGRVDFVSHANDAASDVNVTGPCTQWSSFDPPTRIEALSTAFSDWSPGISPDGTLLALSDWDGTTGQYDVGIAVADPTGAFTSPQVRVAGLDTVANWETEPSFTRDGTAVVFTVEVLASSTWSIASAPLVDPAHAGAWTTLYADAEYNTEPELSADGLRLYFTTNNHPATNGHLQLGVSTRASTADSFPSPTIFTELDTTSNQAAGTLSADELEMIFMSDRPGASGWALYHTTRTAIDQPWSPPTVITELDSPNDDLGPSLSRDGSTLYLNYDTIYGGTNSDPWVTHRTCLARGP